MHLCDWIYWFRWTTRPVLWCRRDTCFAHSHWWIKFCGKCSQMAKWPEESMVLMKRRATLTWSLADTPVHMWRRHTPFLQLQRSRDIEGWQRDHNCVPKKSIWILSDKCLFLWFTFYILALTDVATDTNDFMLQIILIQFLKAQFSKRKKLSKGAAGGQRIKTSPNTKETRCIRHLAVNVLVLVGLKDYKTPGGF